MNRHSVILSHSGKQHSYYVAKALLDLGYLQKFYTSSYITSPIIQKFIKTANRSFWSRRFEAGLGGEFVNANWRYEVRELLMRKLKGNTQAVNDLVLIRDIKFDRDISKRLKRRRFEAFWGFQGSCLESLKTANAMNKETICEMTTVHIPFVKKILAEEAALNPEWADSMVFSPFPSHYEARLIAEPHEAKRVIAISRFLKTTLIDGGVDSEKISVIPLGFDASAIRFNPHMTPLKNRPLRLLYAGKITLGKGIKYLLDAIKQFDKRDVELHIIGDVYGSGNAFNMDRNSFEYMPGVSQQTMFQLYSDYDVLVLPSILEGFGLVTVEAMGAGLPVITTPNTNATELITDGINGFVVPIRNSREIAESIKKIRSMTDDQFHMMRLAARTSALRYTWNIHMDNVLTFLNKLNEPNA